MGFASMRMLLCLSMVLVATGQMKAQATLHWVGSWAASQQTPETANLLWLILLWSMHLWSTDFARDCLAIRQNAAALKTSI